MGDAHRANENDRLHVEEQRRRRTHPQVEISDPVTSGYHQATWSCGEAAHSSLSPSYGGLDEDDRALSSELS